MTIETPVSPNRCAEFLDARQRGEVKGRVEWQNADGDWAESSAIADQFRDLPNPNTPRGYYRIVHEPAPVKVPALDAVRDGLTILRSEGIPRDSLPTIVAHQIKVESGSLVVFDRIGDAWVPVDSDGMVEVLPDEPRRVTVELDEGHARRMASENWALPHNRHVAAAIRDALRCSDTSDEREEGR